MAWALDKGVGWQVQETKRIPKSHPAKQLLLQIIVM